LGWNIYYEFNDSDLETSNTMLRSFLDSPDDIPWDALLFMIGHINYGGRVTDDNDRRLLLSCFKEHCQVDCLKDSDKFSPSGIYYAPEDPEDADGIDIYRDYIDSLPLEEDPEIFGLHDNANIIYE